MNQPYDELTRDESRKKNNVLCKRLQSLRSSTKMFAVINLNLLLKWPVISKFQKPRFNTL
jgi:hypothetical protein